MTTDALYKELTQVSALREHRLAAANLVINNIDLLPKLINITFMVDDKVSCRAAWVLEFTCSKQLDLIIPFLTTFTNNIHKVHLDSAVRPVAKICELLITSHYSKKESSFKTVINETHKTKITEACFDWMINDEKIAPKAYAMHTLYLLGQEYNWIHPELVDILERDFYSQSAGFKARARKLIKKIKANL
ncbi:adenylosuccinate lyase [Flavobacteriaceae bacterium AU392]|nr:adenylosuccinate lyase [Flavobacteriaceae bacterium]RKM83516.1 adenylosuccinate lyase [Flavobacteriaceae bacterium AU392]